MISKKYFHHCMGLLLVAMAWASCTTEEWEDFSDERVATLLVPSIEKAAGTRAKDNTWGTADEVGIFMLAKTGSVGTTLPGLAGDGSATHVATTGNLRYKATPKADDNTKATLTPFSATVDTLYYPLDNSEVRFIAYYPYTSSLGTGYIYPVNVTTDQSVAANQEKVDLLYHNVAATTGKRTTPQVALNFSHQLTKVVINMKRGTGMEGYDLTKLTSKLKNFPTKADFALADGTLDNQGTVADIVPFKITGTDGTTASLYKAQAIIVPHGNYATDGFGGRMLHFVVDDFDQNYTIPNTNSFDGNKIYVYNLVMTRTSIELENVTITDWVDSGFSGGMGGNSVLNTSREELYFSSEGITKYSLIIKTNLDEPDIKFRSGSSDTDAEVSWMSHPGLVELGTEGGLTVYELQLAVQSGAVIDETGYIHVSATTSSGSTLTRLVKVNRGKNDAKSISWVDIQQPSNCYIIHPYGRGIAIPVSRANEHLAGAIGGVDAITFELLWSDTKGSNGLPVCSDANIGVIQTVGIGATGYIVVHPGNAEGNALIAVKVGGEIKWSWHIWTTAYDPERTKTPLFNNFHFMDRNLGATPPKGYNDIQTNTVESRGYLYQWGRKDPFPAADDWNSSTEKPHYDINGDLVTTTIAPVGEVAINVVIANPTTFILGRDVIETYGDWINVRNDNMWNGLDGKKALYDPCPIGWRVPPVDMTPASAHQWIGPWKGLSYKNATWIGHGFYNETIGWYPAVGARDGYAGNYTFNDAGEYWSATSAYGGSGFDSRRYAFRVRMAKYITILPDEESGGQAYNHNRNRSSGLSVRCVKE